MKYFESEQAIGQLEKIKGGYFFLKIGADIIDQFEKKRHTRMICHLDKKVSYRCGLNHLGDGNYFIIVATKVLQQLNKEVGDRVHFKIEEDPDQLGVEMPEVLSTLFTQDDVLKSIFDRLSDGKKRSLIYTMLKSKDIEKQVREVLTFLEKEDVALSKKLKKS